MNISVENRNISIAFDDGLIYTFPADGNARLAAATDAALKNVEINAFGIYWPEVDEDLSFAGLAKGDYGQHVRRMQNAA